ncbi:hypothetical protein L915_10122 [Phytophthora nicotianae]|uniref:Uncharacterized protein n=1 Tax=Phytophthora nicotianae TaxID=4792 RepID=W2GQ28_PHYNI|nr:hypothetical protein L915_10122 [Phytophthora nicotianae]
MSITAKDKTTIADVNAEITEYFKTKDTFRIIEQLSTESIIKKIGQDNAKPCLTLMGVGFYLVTKA